MKSRVDNTLATHAVDRADSDLHNRMAAPAFLLTLVFLALFAGLVVCFIDIPRVAELASVEASEASDSATLVESGLSTSAQQVGRWLFLSLMMLWPLYWLEFAWSLHADKRDVGKPGHRPMHVRARLLACFVPPLRLGSVINAKNDRLWLPVLGWQVPGRTLLKQLELKAAKPMLLVAFLILPVLALEYVFKDFMLGQPWLQTTLHVATGFIWWSFAIEFIIMVSATDDKFQYIKKNWIDLVIIVLPLVSFLRTIRVLRLARLARVQQISKVTRVYRMRGLIAKVMRGLMLMQLISKVLRIKPEKTLEKLYESKSDKEEELRALQAKIKSLEKTVGLSKAGACDAS